MQLTTLSLPLFSLVHTSSISLKYTKLVSCSRTTVQSVLAFFVVIHFLKSSFTNITAPFPVLMHFLCLLSVSLSHQCFPLVRTSFSLLHPALTPVFYSPSWSILPVPRPVSISPHSFNPLSVPILHPPSHSVSFTPLCLSPSPDGFRLLSWWGWWPV